MWRAIHDAGISACFRRAGADHLSMATRTQDAQRTPTVSAGAGLWGGRLLTFPALPSTNRWALDHAPACGDGDVIRAVRQTAGRGRLDRTWIAPGARSLTVSVVLRHSDRVSPAANLAQVAALAAAGTLQGYGIDVRLKWPNDVMVRGRKIAGILAEGTPDAGPVIVGIGININVSREDLCQAALDGTATSMAIERGRLCRTEHVLRAFLRELEKELDATAERGLPYLLEAWAHKDALAGQHIEVRTADGTQRGRYAGLADDGRLRLIDATGREHLFWTGDVSRVRRI